MAHQFEKLLRFGGHMPIFFTFIFLSYDTLQHITSRNFYMTRHRGRRFMSGAAVVSHGSHHIVVMRLGQARFQHGIGDLKVTVSSDFFCFCLSSPLGLEPATHTAEALADRYMNGSQLLSLVQAINHSDRPHPHQFEKLD